MSVQRFTRALAGAEDLLLGEGQVQQDRGLATVSISKLNASLLPFSGNPGDVGYKSVAERFNTTVYQTSSSGAALLPGGTSQERPVATPGSIRYNSDIPGYEISSAGVWKTLALAESVSAITPEDLSLAGNSLVLTLGDTSSLEVDLSQFLDEDARAIASGVLDGVTGIVTFTRDDETTFTLDLSALLDDTNLVTSVAGKIGAVTLVKSDVGLSNVDNTADSTKNVLSATKLTTARTIGGVSFDGTANINLPGVNTTGNQNTSGSAAKLTTARTIALSGDVTGSVSFDGSANATITATVADDSHNHIISNVDGLQTALDNKLDLTATAATATKLATARTIALAGDVSGSVSFDGSANTTITATVADDSHNHVIGNVDGLQTALDGKLGLTATATAATKLATARTINGVAFDGTANITINAVDSTARIAASEKGAINGVATLDAAGLIPSTQLPSYVDDVLEFANLAGFPATGESSKIYVALDTNKTYRWSGTAYVYITSGAVDSVAGKTGVVTLVKGDVGLGNVDNTADSAKNVLSATKLTTARTITLSGDVTGSVSFDGSANATIAATVADDSHNHIIANVDGLQTALDSKLNLSGGTMTGDLTISKAGSAGFGVGSVTAAATIKFVDPNNNQNVEITHDPFDSSIVAEAGYALRIRKTADNAQPEYKAALVVEGNIYAQNNSKVWHAGNDGSGSGLDADLLDGQQGSYYQNASNLNAGTVPSARLTGSYAISVTGSSGSTTGNAATATKLATARTINGVPFDGTANITIATAAAWG